MFASASSSLNIYSLEKKDLKLVSKYCPKLPIKQISWCYDNSHIAILQENGFAEILSTLEPNNLILVHTISTIPNVTSIKFKTNTKKIIALGTSEGQVLLYDTKNRCISKKLDQVPSNIAQLHFNFNSELLAVLGDKMATVFNLISQERQEQTFTDQCSALRWFNKNYSLLTIGSTNGTICIWGIKRNCELKSFQVHSAEVTDIAISKDDKLIVSSGRDNRICVFDYSAQQYIFRQSLLQAVLTVDLSADDEQMIFAGLEDGSIYINQMADYVKSQLISNTHASPIRHIACINEFATEIMETNSTMQDRSCFTNVEKTTNEKEEDSPEEPTEVPEEKVKTDLIQIINSQFIQLEGQLANHCEKVEFLINNELDSLYKIAARWECFNRLEMQDIIRFVSRIKGASLSEPKTVSQRSQDSNSNLP